MNHAIATGAKIRIAASIGTAERRATFSAVTGSPAYRKNYDPAAALHYSVAKEAARSTHRGEVALAVRALRGVARDESLLDLPCGAARMTVELARLGFERLTAADVSPAMQALARERLAREGLAVAVVAADAERLPFADREFDNVFCFRLFHHFPDDALRAQVAAELCRVAGRRVLVSYLDRRAFTARKRQLQSWWRPRAASKFTQSPAEVAACFERAGFRAVADLARFPYWHSLRMLIAERRCSAPPLLLRPPPNRTPPR
jgi:ubiquinone/menaquinone biosynthesis C-methylase UbiE